MSLVAIVLFSAFAGLPAPAEATIIAGKGIARVGIGFSEAHVRRILGRPRRVIPPAWVFGHPLEGRVGFNPSRRVNDIWTVSGRERTTKSIGPGSSLRATRRAYPRARCHRRKRMLRALCVLSRRHRHSLAKTDFLFIGRRLRKVEIYVMPLLKPRGTQ